MARVRGIDITKTSAELGYTGAQLGDIYVTKSSNRNVVYKLVHIASDSTAVTDGTVLCLKTADRTQVTADRTDSDQNDIEGVAIGTVTVDYYCWIQVWGPHSSVQILTAASAAIGDLLIVHSTEDGATVDVADGTAPAQIIVGVAEAVVANSGVVTVAANLKIMSPA